MRFSQLIAPQQSIVVEEQTPLIGPRQLLITISICGVCASELHPWHDGVEVYPRRFGHEPVGIVSQVGAEVTRFKPGDRVTGLLHGAYSDECIAEEANVLHVPEGVSDVAALGEPLACLVNAQRRTPVQLADRVALIGLGFMGLGLLQLLKLRGPREIVAIDVREESRELAKQFGADVVCHPDEVPAVDKVTRFADWSSNRGFDVVVEASGTQAGLTLAGQLVRAHGVLSILGFHQGGKREVDVEMWNWKAIDVINAHVRRHADLMESMRIGLDLEAKGLIDLGALVSHRYPLSDVDQAYTDLHRKPAGFVKAIVVP